MPQATILDQRFGYRVIGTGDLFRVAIREQGLLGRAISAFVERGDLVPDDLTMSLVDEALGDRAVGGLIFDGVPRTVEQAKALDEVRRLDSAIQLHVPIDTIVDRLALRRVCRSAGHPYAWADPDEALRRCPIDDSPLDQRVDDEPAVVRHRIDRQAAALHSVTAYYESTDRLIVIDGDRPVRDMTDAVLDVIERGVRRSALDWVAPRHRWILGLVDGSADN